MRARVVATILMSLLTVAACKSQRGEQLRTGPLYERVQRDRGLHAVADKVSAAVVADPTFGPRFAKVDMARFRAQLAAFLCHAAGGPCPYAAPLHDVWTGVTLGDDEFIAFMDLVIAGMNEAGLPQQEQNDLIDLLMKAQADDAAATAAAG